MYQTFYFNENIAFGQEITTKERVDAYSNVVFLLSGASHLQGVQHSSSLPDYIEDKKSGGQKTDRHNTSLCNDSTIIIGREARKCRMLKTVINPYLIGTL